MRRYIPISAVREVSRTALQAQWPVFIVLVVILFLSRGIGVLAVLPPGEGWDEYQHVAYIDFVHENGRSPIFGESDVAPELLSEVVRWPQPHWALDQVGATNAAGYPRFWTHSDQVKLVPLGVPLRLYEAQHPPLFYWLMSPVYGWCGGRHHLGRAVAVLRLINLGFAAGAVGVAVAWFGRICADRRHAAVIALALATCPLFLLNAARVANDPLAVFLGVVAFVLATGFGTADDARGTYSRAAIVGVVLGLGILAKATDLTVLPFVAICLFIAACRRKLGWGRAVVGGAIVLTLVAAVTGRYFAFNLRHFGLLTPMQEAVTNRALGHGLRDQIRYLSVGMWIGLARAWWAEGGLWVGGWSFLFPAVPFVTGYWWLIELALVGWPVGWLYRRERLIGGRFFTDPMAGVWCAAMWLCVNLGMVYHAIQCLSASGGTVMSTMAWYGAVAAPAFLTLFVRGLLSWRHSRLGIWPALALPLFYLAVEAHGVVTLMVPTYTLRPWGPTALHRLASLHPHWLGEPTLLSAMAAVAVLVAVLVATVAAAAAPAPSAILDETNGRPVASDEPIAVPALAAK